MGNFIFHTILVVRVLCEEVHPHIYVGKVLHQMTIKTPWENYKKSGMMVEEGPATALINCLKAMRG